MLVPVMSVRRPTRSEGFSLISVLVAVTVLVIGLLGQTSLALSSHRLITEQGLRTHAIGAAKQMISRLRSDDDWSGLYDRLLLREFDAAAGAAPIALGAGRTAWPPTAYYPDFVPPPALDDFGLVIRVPPPAPPADAPTSAPSLREDLSLPAFGLPGDLNGDGLVDGDTHGTDYRTLPVVLHLRWRGLAGDSQEMKIGTWIRGPR